MHMLLWSHHGVSLGCRYRWVACFVTVSACAEPKSRPMLVEGYAEDLESSKTTHTHLGRPFRSADSSMNLSYITRRPMSYADELSLGFKAQRLHVIESHYRTYN